MSSWWANESYFWRKRSSILLTDTLLGVALSSVIVAILGLFISSTISANGAVIGGLAGGLVAFVISLRNTRRRDKETPLLTGVTPPTGLIDVLRDHGVREFGSMYLYMPLPRRARDERAWAWVEMLTAKGLIRGEPWHIKAQHVKETIREHNPRLFEGSPPQFDVYRLDWRALTQMMGDDLD